MPIHWQIIIALIVGAIFGAIFSVEKDSLVVVSNGKESTINKIYSVKLLTDNSDEFANLENLSALQIVNSLKKKVGKYHEIVLLDPSGRELYSGMPDTIKAKSTIATAIKPIGSLFIKLLAFISIPLVLSTIIVGAASLGDIKKIGRIGAKAIAFFMSTTVIAITIGIVLANVIQPGKSIDTNIQSNLSQSFDSEETISKVADLQFDIVDFFIDIVPRNPFAAIANGEMLQIVFFALVIGFAVNLANESKKMIFIDFFDALGEALISITLLIMKFAPIAVFALIAATIADFGFEILYTLIWYSLAVLIGLALQTFGIYALIVKFFSDTKVGDFFKGIREAQIIGFSVSSSAATLPVTYSCVEKKLGVRRQISGFVLPLGATINMDGTALYQGVAAIFIAQVYAIDLSIAQQVTIVITAVLASIGTAPVPGVGLIMLVMILNSVGIPAEGIALIVGVDRLLDMARTITNITGDASVAVAINHLER